MGDPLKEQDEALAAQAGGGGGRAVAGGVAGAAVYDRGAEPLLSELGPLPEEGAGTGAAVGKLLRVGTATATASGGARFAFVIGRSTPASLAADWVVSLLDQNAFVRASSRLADASRR